MTLDVIQSPNLSQTPHGFFGRQGGASSGVFAGLNCGYGSSDQRDIVSINRRRVAAHLGVDHTALVGVHQVHSAKAIAASEPFQTAPQADGVATATPGIALGVLTADCQPILLADAISGVIAAAHAGWRGALDGVIEATVAQMTTLGADRTRIHAVIGPSISQPNYEVGAEFRDRFLKADSGYDRFFAPGKPGHFHFDLPAFGLWQLKQSGVTSASWTGHCTYADPTRFYSYRRSLHQSEADYGRLMAAIRLPA